MLFANAGRLQYSISDIPNFLRARTLAAKADASIDQSGFQEVVARHSSEGYDSYKYFDKQLWLRSKMMRVIELGLDKSPQASVLDLGCGAGYFLYCCKYLGHNVHGVDLPDYEFYKDMIALFGLSRTGFRIEPYKNLPLLGRRFDVITAHQICFNGHKTEKLGLMSGIFSSTRSKKIASIPAAPLRLNSTRSRRSASTPRNCASTLTHGPPVFSGAE